MIATKSKFWTATEPEGKMKQKRARTITERLTPALAGMETEVLARVQAEAEARAVEMYCA